MINIKLRMSIEQIIFNLLNKNAHTWVRYWQQKEMSGLTMPGEYIEIRTFFLSGIEPVSYTHLTLPTTERV
mgnify:CR=1 FL=1